MISEGCIEQITAEMASPENTYEYVYSCFAVFILVFQIFVLIDYCLFRIHYENQYDINANAQKARRIPAIETDRRIRFIYKRLESMETDLESIKAGTLYCE